MEWIIILSCVGGAIAVALVAVLLYFFVFRHVWAKKQVRELSRRFEYLHALLFGQDSQYIKRIENISTTNLLYVNTHVEFKKRFKDVRDQADSSAQSAINDLKDMLSEHRYKALKERIPQAKKTMDYYDEQVNRLNDDLLVVIKPEEDCRQESLQLKEQLRKIKQDYYVKQSDLALVSSSFEKVFQNLDAKFKEFESYVEGALYSEATQMLPLIGGVLKQLSKALKDMPDLCVTIQTVIPEKLDSLENRFDELTKAGYPLHHLLFRTNIEEMRNQTAAIGQRIQQFDLSGAQQELDGILAKIEEYFDSFEKEKSARVKFENECDGVYRKDSEIEKKYIRLCNALPDIRKIYVIASAEQSKLDEIQKQINKAGATKRSLDTLIHSNTKQPYTLLLEKMTTLKEESEKSDSAIDEFNQYLFSLKKDTDDAASAIQRYFYELAQDEYIIRKIGLEEVNQRFQPTLDRLHEVIDSIYKAFSACPIDVDAVNSYATELKGSGEKLANDLKILANQEKLAEAAILYGNRDRYRFSDLSSSLSQSEALYFHGEFDKSYEEATSAMKRLRGE